MPFGFEFYKPPKVERAYLKPHNTKMDKAKIQSCIQKEVTSKSFIPGASYNTTFDWSTMIKGDKGKFLKSPRLTVTEEIIKKKSKASPSPA